MRLDKLLTELNIGSRSEVKKIIKQKRITVDGQVVLSPDYQVTTHQEIQFDNKSLIYKKYHYYLFNKPAGVITATHDKNEKTVLDVLLEKISEENPDLAGIPISDLSPVGRLDKDTTGLLLITNDGELNHRLLSPKKHVPKTYYVETNQPIPLDAVDLFKNGVDIGDDSNTLPSDLKILDEISAYITITEGRYHQIKRMFHTIGLKVIKLHRISMGHLLLPESLKPGDYIELNDEMIQSI